MTNNCICVDGDKGSRKVKRFLPILFLFILLSSFTLVSASSFAYNYLIPTLNLSAGGIGPQGPQGIPGINGLNGTNGTSFSNFSLYLPIANWNSTNTSYYLNSNPLGFYNNITNFTSKRTDGRACIYISATDKMECDSNFLESETKWNANYSTFLTHISWSNIINGTIWSWITNGTMATTSYVDTQNQSLVNYIKLQNDSNNNGDLVQDTAINTSMKNYIDNTFNTTRNNYITSLGYISYPTANNGSLFSAPAANLTIGSATATQVTISNMLTVGYFGIGLLPTNGTAGWCFGNGTVMRNSTGTFGCGNTKRWKQLF